MRKLISIAWTTLRLEFTEPISLVFFIVLPVIFTLVIGLGMGASFGPSADQRARIAVVDLDHSSIVDELVTSMAASNVVKPETASSAAAAQDELAKGSITGIITISKGFQASLLAGEPTQIDLVIHAGANQGSIEQAIRTAITQVSTAVSVARSSVQERIRIQPFKDVSEQQAYFTVSLDEANKAIQDPVASSRVVYPAVINTTIASGFEQTSPGQLVTWTLVTLLTCSETFVNERVGGTLRRLLITPTHRATIIAGKILGWLAMGFIQMSLLVGFGALVLHIQWGRSPLALVLILGGFDLASVSLGVLLGTLVRTRSQASSLSTLIAMFMSALGGAWWPLEVTPKIYQTVVQVLPTTWAMTGMNNIILRGEGIAQVWPQAAALTGFAAVFLFVAIRRLKFE
jgi:ABC-2 type transport system permease protein